MGRAKLGESLDGMHQFPAKVDSLSCRRHPGSLESADHHRPKKAPARFELAISCLLDRRFNQLSHGAGVRDEPIFPVDIPLATHAALGMGQATT